MSTFCFRLNNNFSSLLFVPLVYTDGNYSLFTDVFLLDQVNPALAVLSQRVFIFLGTLSVLSFCVQGCLGPYAVFPMRLCPGAIGFPSSAGYGSPDGTLSYVSPIFSLFTDYHMSIHK